MAVKWLVATSRVQTRKRASPPAVEEPVDQDWLYQYGQGIETCTLVLQGRICVRVGRDGFRSEAGAFSLLARDALREGSASPYCPDFSAFVGTPEVRYLLITKKQFLKARELDNDVDSMNDAWCKLHAFNAGELSRKNAREFHQQNMCWSPANVDVVGDADSDGNEDQTKRWPLTPAYSPRERSRSAYLAASLKAATESNPQPPARVSSTPCRLEPQPSTSRSWLPALLTSTRASPKGTDTKRIANDSDEKVQL